MKWLFLGLSILCYFLVNFFLKLSSTYPHCYPLLKKPQTWLNFPFWLGIISYILGFFVYSHTLTLLPLGIAYPLMNAGIMLLIPIIGIIYFKEAFYWTTGLGILCMLMGTTLISYNL